MGNGQSSEVVRDFPSDACDATVLDIEDVLGTFLKIKSMNGKLLLFVYHPRQTNKHR